MHLILKRSVTQFAESAKEELTCEGVERFSFVQADQHAPPECFVAKILQQVRRSLQLAHLGEGSGYLVLARIGSEFAHEQACRDGPMPDRGGHTSYLIPLFDDQLALDLTKEQALE